jgi:acetylornithine deacetylase/succinyl-diaminopimelate desuccinylase-like protein
MPAFICTACGTQYPPADTPPALCAICEEERQYVPPSGQSWATQDKLAGVRKPIMLLAHIDVVEAKREDWSVDPFKLTEQDG